MELVEIEIRNYKSISEVNFDCRRLADHSQTFGLIGMNEAGKSSFLKGVSATGTASTLSLKDFRDRAKKFLVWLQYEISKTEFAAWEATLKSADATYDPAHYVQTRLCIHVEFEAGGEKHTYVMLDRAKTDGEDSCDFFEIDTVPTKLAQTPIFWTASEKYMIAQPIDLSTFAADPAGTSIPLRNCFLLAGIDQIPARIGSIQGDSTEIEHLQRVLGASVTKHIQAVWPEHPIEISFLIADNAINFHVRDKGADGKAKTADQRSDGFRQFVSFLLTVSAQNKNQELTNTILLLDEPETHLHPLAQEYLL